VKLKRQLKKPAAVFVHRKEENDNFELAIGN
jgi:hypothetical protein